MPPQRAVGGQRLGLEHVERGAGEMPRVDRGDQVGFDQHAAARDVDHVGAARQLRERPRVEEARASRRSAAARRRGSGSARGKPAARPCPGERRGAVDRVRGSASTRRPGNPRRDSTSTTGAPIEPKPITPTANSALRGGRRAVPARLALLRLEARQLAIVAQRHQRDVLRHAHALQRIDGAHDRHVRGEIGRGEHLVDAGARAGDEPQRGKARGDARRDPERENRLDLVRRRGRGIGEDRLRRARARAARRAAVRRTARSAGRERP